MSDSVAARRAELRPAMQQALDFAAEQSRCLLKNHPGYHPMYTVGGRWAQEGESWTHWCEGFFPGILWLLHKQTGIPSGANRPSVTAKFLSRDGTAGPSDLGFLFFSTYLRWYHLTDRSGPARRSHRRRPHAALQPGSPAATWRPSSGRRRYSSTS